MSMQEQTARSIEVTNEDQVQDEQWIVGSIIKAKAAPAPSSTARIHGVPRMVRETGDYDKFYVPKVVSIGPHHFGNKKLELVEKLKPVFTMKLLSNNEETLRSLSKKLGDPKMVEELRNFYEENLRTKYCNKVFTKIMLLDACFILYYIKFIFGKKPEDCPDLNIHEIVFIYEDLFLLENQIPFKVVREVMTLAEIDCEYRFQLFICGRILPSAKPKNKWLKSIPCIVNNQCYRGEQNMELKDADHLLHLLHRTLTQNAKFPMKDMNPHERRTFGNVNELVDVGIHFKPSDTMSWAHIKFVKCRWWFTASVELPPITMDDSTKPMLLNLIAYEMCSRNDAGVTSYICLLNSLIDYPEDVKALRKAGVLENSHLSDKEVTKLFKEIGPVLFSNNLAHLDAKNMIQKHYQSWSNTLISQLKHEYVKSPWAFFALLGALIALFLSGVQTYFTVWSPKGECDDLCTFLRKNHH